MNKELQDKIDAYKQRQYIYIVLAIVAVIALLGMANNARNDVNEQIRESVRIHY